MLKHLITFTALLLALSAIGYLLIPRTMLTIVGIDSNPQLDFVLRASGAGILALVPGIWALRTQSDASLNRAVVTGLVGYLLLSSVVDFHAYTQSIVNFASIPSIAFRLLLGAAIAIMTRNAKKKLH